MTTTLRFLVLFFCLFIAGICSAQTEYGDGSQRLRADRLYVWDNDTLKWDWRDSATYNYDAANNLIEDNNKIYVDSTGEWKSNKVIYKTYNSGGQTIIHVDSLPLMPLYSTRKEVTYDVNGKETLALMYKWPDTTWVVDSRTQTTYTGFDKVDVRLTERYIGGVWKADERELHTYNGSNLDSIIRFEEWYVVDNGWRPRARILLTYDGSGNVISQITQVWNNDSMAYNNFSFLEMSYDTANRIATESDARWVKHINGWRGDNRKSYEYNTMGQLKNFLFERFDTLANSFVFSGLTKNTYDVNNRLTVELNQNWTNNSWTDSYRSLFTYDTHGYRVNWKQEVYDANLLSWRNGWNTDYWYGPNVVNIIDVNEDTEAFQVYPNPANNIITVDANFKQDEKTSVWLFNTSGKKIAELSNYEVYSAGPKSFDLSKLNLADGVYILSVKTGSKVSAQPLIIK